MEFVPSSQCHWTRCNMDTYPYLNGVQWLDTSRTHFRKPRGHGPLAPPSATGIKRVFKYLSFCKLLLGGAVFWNSFYTVLQFGSFWILLMVDMVLRTAQVLKINLNELLSCPIFSLWFPKEQQIKWTHKWIEFWCQNLPTWHKIFH